MSSKRVACDGWSLMLPRQIPWPGGIAVFDRPGTVQRYARERQQQLLQALTDWGRQTLLQPVRRRQFERRIIGVTDASFAAIELLNSAALLALHDHQFAASTPDCSTLRHAAERHHWPVWRDRQALWPTLRRAPGDRRTYGGGSRSPAGMAAASAWSRSCPGPPSGIIPAASSRSATCWSKMSPVNLPQAFLCTDLDADPLDIFCAGSSAGGQSRSRCRFEVRCRHLGVETCAANGPTLPSRAPHPPRAVLTDRPLGP